MNKYFLQIDPDTCKLFDGKFPKNNFLRFSCYFCSIANLVMQTSDHYFNENDLLRIALEAVEKDFMDNDFYIKKPDELIKLFSPDYGFIDKVDKSHPNHDKAIGAIECWVNGKYKHFKLGFCDPMNGTSRTVKEGELVSYRLFNRIY